MDRYLRYLNLPNFEGSFSVKSWATAKAGPRSLAVDLGVAWMWRAPAAEVLETAGWIFVDEFSG